MPNAAAIVAALCLAFVGCDKPEAAPPAPVVPPVATSTPEPLRLSALKADVLTALARHGFTLTPEDVESQAFTLSRYRVAGSSAVVLFIEQGGRLDTIAITMERRGTASRAELHHARMNRWSFASRIAGL